MSRAARRVLRQRRVQRAAAKATRATAAATRVLVVSGEREAVRAIEAIACSMPGVELGAPGIPAVGPAITGVRIELIGSSDQLDQVERTMRRAAASRPAFVEPFMSRDEVLRAQALASHFTRRLGLGGAEA